MKFGIEPLVAVAWPCRAWNNGAAPRPPMGWQNWNSFHNEFNYSGKQTERMNLRYLLIN